MNFVELQSEIASWLNRTDLTANIPTFIKMAQWDIEHGIPIAGIAIPNRGLWKSMRVYTTGSTLTADSAYLSFPTRYRESRWFAIYSGGVYYTVKKRTLEYCLRAYPLNDVDPIKAMPKYFASDDANSRFVFVPTPDSAYSYVHDHYAYHAELQNVSYGADKVTNGAFATDTGWTKGTGWTISGGTANHAAGNTATLNQDLSTSFNLGSIFKVIFTVSGRTAGTIKMSIASDSGIERDTNETFTEYITLVTSQAAPETLIYFTPTIDFNGSIDNVQVFLTTGTTNTNWWTENAWEVLFYGALCKVAPFLMGDERLIVWKTEFKSMLDGLASVEIHSEFSDKQGIGHDEVVV